MGQTTFSGPVKSDNGFIDPTDLSNAKTIYLVSEELEEVAALTSTGITIPADHILAEAVLITLTAASAANKLISLSFGAADPITGNVAGSNALGSRTATTLATDPTDDEDRDLEYDVDNGVANGAARYRVLVKIVAPEAE